ncbi:UNVERIFIED_CONTAM: hypothetical protein O8I53_13310 [Campylobacter lari]
MFSAYRYIKQNNKYIILAIVNFIIYILLALSALLLLLLQPLNDNSKPIVILIKLVPLFLLFVFNIINEVINYIETRKLNPFDSKYLIGNFIAYALIINLLIISTILLTKFLNGAIAPDTNEVYLNLLFSEYNTFITVFTETVLKNNIALSFTYTGLIISVIAIFISFIIPMILGVKSNIKLKLFFKDLFNIVLAFALAAIIYQISYIYKANVNVNIFIHDNPKHYIYLIVLFLYIALCLGYFFIFKIKSFEKLNSKIKVFINFTMVLIGSIIGLIVYMSNVNTLNQYLITLFMMLYIFGLYTVNYFRDKNTYKNNKLYYSLIILVISIQSILNVLNVLMINNQNYILAKNFINFNVLCTLIVVSIALIPNIIQVFK